MLQVVDDEAKRSWTKVELEPEGEVESAYTWSGAELSKVRVRYVTVRTAFGEAPGGAAGYGASGESRITLTADGWPKSVSASQRDEIPVGPARLVALGSARAELVGTTSHPELVAAFERDRASFDPDVEATAQISKAAQRDADRALLGGAELGALMTKLDESADGRTRGRAVLQMSALMRLDPSAVKGVAFELKKTPTGPRSLALLGALGGAGTPEAHHALGEVLASDAPSETRVAAAQALAMAPSVAVGAFSACSSNGDVRCGAGTHDEAGVCVADSVTQNVGANRPAPPGASTDGSASTDGYVAGGPARPDAGPRGPSCAAGYELRTSALKVPADGFSNIAVVAFGRTADGGLSTEQVVLSVTPPGRATLAPAAFALEPTGTTTYFMPCRATDPSCTGSFQITMALASAPNVVVASTPAIELVAPTGLGSAAACLTGGNVAFFDGKPGDYIHPGKATVTAGRRSATAESAAPKQVTVHLEPSGSGDGLWWDFEFSSARLDQPLAITVYPSAERAPFASPGHPGLDVTGDGRGCNTLTGTFQVHDLTMSGADVASFTATFEQHCEGGAPALRGCVHYEK